MYIYIYICIYILYIYTGVCMYVCMHMYAYVCICMHMYAYVCICMYMYAYVCMYVYVCVSMYMYVYVLYVCDCVWVTGLTFVQDWFAGAMVTSAPEKVVVSIGVEVDRLAQLMSEEINQYTNRAPKVTMFSVIVLQQHIVTLVDTTTKKQRKCDTSF